MDRLRPVRHGSRRIEQHQQLRIRLAAIALQVTAVGPREDVPIDVPQIVSRRVSPVLGELLREPEVRRPVEAIDKPVDHGLGHQVKPGNGRERVGIEESLEHLFHRRHF